MKTIKEQTLELIASIENGDIQDIADKSNRLKAILTSPDKYISIYQLEEYLGCDDLESHILDLCNEVIEPRQFREDVLNSI